MQKIRCMTPGFTLLEVMVALAVLAIALAAMIKVSAENAANAAYLRDKTLEHWVGMNVVAEQQLAANWIQPRTRRGEEEMGNHVWYWSANISETFDKDVSRLDVVVSSDNNPDAASLASLIAFIATPVKESR